MAIDKDFIKEKKEFLTSIKKGKNASIELQYASEGLQADKEIVMAAVNQPAPEGFAPNTALSFASKELQADKEIVLAAVKQNGFVLSFASKELQGDKEIVIAAVMQDFSALEYASENLRSNKEIILAAVKKDGDALQYVSKEHLSDKEIVLAAVGNFGSALQYASKELKANKEIVMAACASVNSGGIPCALEIAIKSLQADKEIVLTAVKQNGMALEFASKELKTDKEIVLTAVKQNGMALEYASKLMQGDKEIVKFAIAKDKRASQFVVNDFKINAKSDDDNFITSLGKTENQLTCLFDISKVNFKDIEKNAKKILLDDTSLFKNDYPLSKKASKYSSFDFSKLFNSKVLFLTYLSGYQGSLNITFSADPTDYIFEEYGRLNKNLHLSIFIDDGEMEINLEREHFYNYDDIDDEDIIKKCEKIEKKDKSNKKWNPFVVSNLNYDEFEKFKLKFKKHFNEDDIWL